MRAAAADSLQLALAHGKGGGTYQALVERDVLVANSVQRMSRLELGRESLCFGRIDRDDGESFQIGPLAVPDESHEPLLVAWRAPGRGKTAVALHRAAYLLYTHRFPLERQGVLVVGPNRLFMRYIEHVLPSLGESGVELSTIGGLVGHLDAGGDEPAATARLKG